MNVNDCDSENISELLIVIVVEMHGGGSDKSGSESRRSY